MKHLAIESCTISIETLLALAEPALRLDFKKKRDLRSCMLGGHRSNIRGQGIEFDDLRAYEPFDDLRQMDWRVTARTGKPHIKLSREERERPVFLVVDFNPSMFFGTRSAFKSVIASQIAALLAWAAYHHGDRVGGLLVSNQEILALKPRARGNGILPLLQALSLFSERRPAHSTPRPYSTILEKLRNVAKPGALIFLISDFYTLETKTEGILKNLKKHHDLRAIYLRDPLEIAPPPPAEYTLTDGVAHLYLNTRIPSIAKRYQALCDQTFEKICTIFASATIPLLALKTTDPWLSLLHSFLNTPRTTPYATTHTSITT